MKRADLFRLAVVAREGGFYFDVDVYAKRSLEPLVAHAAVLPMEWWLSDDAFFERHRRNVLDAREHWQVGNYAFGARPDHPLLVDALDEAANRTLAAAGAPGDADVLRTTGPYMLSEVYHAGRRAGRYADVVLLRGDAEPRVGRATKGGADWHKFGSFAEHLLAHTWVSDARRRLDGTYDDGVYTTTDSGGPGLVLVQLLLRQHPERQRPLPGLPAAAYCDCGDCTGQPDWCACPEALGARADDAGLVLAPGLERPGLVLVRASGDQGSYSYDTSSAGVRARTRTAPPRHIPNDSVLCPGPRRRTRLGGDSRQPDWCACPGALSHCGRTTPVSTCSARLLPRICVRCGSASAHPTALVVPYSAA